MDMILDKRVCSQQRTELKYQEDNTRQTSGMGVIKDGRINNYIRWKKGPKLDSGLSLLAVDLDNMVLVSPVVLVAVWINLPVQRCLTIQYHFHISRSGMSAIW